MLEVVEVDVKQTVQQSITKCQTSASDLRSAAAQTQNPQAKKVFDQVAKTLDDCVQQCRNALNQL